MNIETVKSAGGIEAWLVEERSVPMLALRFAFEGGSSQDPPGKDGLANFVAQMLVEGAGPLAGLAFQERVRDLSLRLGFKAGKDAFVGSLDVLTESRDEAVELLRLALTVPRFDADAAERVSQRLKVAITRAAREPDKVASTEWDAVAFAGHAYARPILGTAAGIGAITADDLEMYRRRVFARDTLKVVAVGDITPEALGGLLDEAFGDLAPNADLTRLQQAMPLAGGRQVIIEMDVPQSVAVFGMGAIPRKDPDYMAAYVLNHIVGGGGFSSRLMEEVRVKRGLAYGVSTSLSPSRYASVLRGSVATRNDMVGQSIDVIRAELRRASVGEIGERDLDNAKSYLIGSYPLSLDANAKIAGQLLGLGIDGLPSSHIGDRNALVAAVGLDDLKRVAKRLLDPENLIVTVVGKPSLRSEGIGGTRIAASAA
jgi:zinc protease